MAQARRAAQIAAMTKPATPDLVSDLEAARGRAMAAGALLPIQVEGEAIADGGVAFRVEWISSLAMKDLAKLVPRAGDKARGDNPFLPYDPDLHVADLSDTHVVILNKFPVWRGHFLIITRAFVEQESPLARADVAALRGAMTAVDGLVFYNAGDVSGASQRHRHLQLIPGFSASVEPLLPVDGEPHVLGRAPALPFDHVFARIDLDALGDDGLFNLLDAACETAGLGARGGRRPPYNLVMTRRWLMVVPRRVESVAGVSVSALGYAGMMGLRSPEQLDGVRAHGPMRMLVDAAGRP
jgi:sulfate adenylyltransferase (ADP) / ATP adenylyltransferase